MTSQPSTSSQAQLKNEEDVLTHNLSEKSLVKIIRHLIETVRSIRTYDTSTKLFKIKEYSKPDHALEKIIQWRQSDEYGRIIEFKFVLRTIALKVGGEKEDPTFVPYISMKYISYSGKKHELRLYEDSIKHIIYPRPVRYITYSIKKSTLPIRSDYSNWYMLIYEELYDLLVDMLNTDFSTSIPHLFGQ